MCLPLDVVVVLAVFAFVTVVLDLVDFVIVLFEVSRGTKGRCLCDFEICKEKKDRKAPYTWGDSSCIYILLVNFSNRQDNIAPKISHHLTPC